jgi:hypothetical protein
VPKAASPPALKPSKSSLRETSQPLLLDPRSLQTLLSGDWDPAAKGHLCFSLSRLSQQTNTPVNPLLPAPTPTWASATSCTEWGMLAWVSLKGPDPEAHLESSE